jgi:hypothetical protein
MCKFIAPIFDIIPLSQLHFDKSNRNTISFIDVGNANKIAITFQVKILKGNELTFTTQETIPIETVFSISGKINRKMYDYLQLRMLMEKKDYNYELIELCKFWGCANIDLKANFESIGDKFYLPFNILDNEVDSEILQMLKLKYMKNQPNYIKNNYKYIKYTTYELEVRADLMYLNLLMEPREGLNKVKFINLIKDYLKLKAIYKSINSFGILSKTIPISELENKINIIELACIKAETRNNQEDLILNRMISDVKIDLERLKNNYIH